MSTAKVESILEIQATISPGEAYVGYYPEKGILMWNNSRFEAPIGTSIIVQEAS